MASLTFDFLLERVQDLPAFHIVESLVHSFYSSSSKEFSYPSLNFDNDFSCLIGELVPRLHEIGLFDCWIIFYDACCLFYHLNFHGFFIYDFLRLWWWLFFDDLNWLLRFITDSIRIDNRLHA